MKKGKMTEEEQLMLKNRLLMEMARHNGPNRKIGMGELFEAVYQESWGNRINDTRAIRTLITDLRREGVAIGSKKSRSDGGYWLMSTASELDEYCSRLTDEAIKKLGQAARLRNIALPTLLGQMALDLQGAA